MSAEEDWIFGYGSLIWRPAFDYRESRTAYVEGWSRRFWQGSPDHRGTPQAPGRVVTLVRDPGARCWGRAFRVSRIEREAIFGALDVREQGGYERHRMTLFEGGDPEPGVALGTALVYLATEENPNYLGPAPSRAIAEQVRACRGPSGENSQYVLELEAALSTMGRPDPHVREIAVELRELELRERAPETSVSTR